MKRNEPKKKTPGSGVIKMGWVDNKLEQSFISEPYPQRQKEIEKVILTKFIKYIREKEHRNTQVSSIKEVDRDREPPDFIYKEKGQNIGAELMELVTYHQAENRSINLMYAEKVRERLNNPALHIEMIVRKKLPHPNSREGDMLIEEIIRIINFSKGEGPPVSGQLCSQIGGFVYHTEEGILGRCAPEIYFSPTGLPIGVHTALTNKDYEDLASKLENKWKADYSDARYSKCVLLLYAFGVRPDFERIKKIIKSLNSKYRVEFFEVWFLKPYPNYIDDVRNLFKFA